MGTFAAVTTGKGIGAISTIEVYGDGANAVIRRVFRPANQKQSIFRPGRIMLGAITDGTDTVDEVTIGCEGPESFAIHCHGNPLIVEIIMELLEREGAILVTSEELLGKRLMHAGPTNAIALEANLIRPRVLTLQGTKLIASQVTHGLAIRAAAWPKRIDAAGLEEVKADAHQILANTRMARPIIFGCRAVMAGPTNSGKSTLFNWLCSRQKSIVTDAKGTTRDWVSAQCRMGPLCVELIDTAGLDDNFPTSSAGCVETTARQKTLEMLRIADLVLLIMDISQPANQLDETLLALIKHRQVIAALNKCDLPATLDVAALPPTLPQPARISAKTGAGVEHLVNAIVQICGPGDFDMQSPVCFTNRQKSLLRQLQDADSKEHAKQILHELLNGPVAEIEPPGYPWGYDG